MAIVDFTEQVMYGITDNMTQREKDIQYAKNAYTQLYGNRDYVNFIFAEVIKDTYDMTNGLYYEEMFSKRFECVLEYTDLECVQLFVVMKLNKGEWYRRRYKIAIDGNLDNFVQVLNRMNNYYMGNIESRNLKKITEQIKEVYESRNYKLFLQDRNYVRYVFREFGDYLVENKGMDSNKMVKITRAKSRSFISAKNYELAIEELIRLGVVNNFMSTRKDKNRYGSVTGTVSSENIGFTPYGWKLYKSQLNK